MELSLTGSTYINLPFTTAKFKCATKAGYKQKFFTFEAKLGRPITFYGITIKEPIVRFITKGLRFSRDASYEIVGETKIGNYDVIGRIISRVLKSGVVSAFDEAVAVGKAGDSSGKAVVKTMPKREITFVAELKSKKPMKPFKNLFIPGVQDLAINDIRFVLSKKPPKSTSGATSSGKTTDSGGKSSKKKKKKLFIIIEGKVSLLGLYCNARLTKTNRGVYLTLTAPPGKPWPLEKLSGGLKQFKIKDSFIIVSSFAFIHYTTQIMVQPGITLGATIDFSKQPAMLPKFAAPTTATRTGPTQVTLAATLNPDPRKSSFTISIPTNTPLSKTSTMRFMQISFGGIPPIFVLKTKIEIQPTPKDPYLMFTGSILGDPTGAFGISASLIGEWRNALGIPGFMLEDVAFELAARAIPVIPFISPQAFGITATSYFGSDPDKYKNVRIEFATKADLSDPSKLMFFASLNKITLAQIVSIPNAALASAHTDKSKPPPRIPVELLPPLSLEDVEISIVPQAGIMIGEKVAPYKEGYTFKGKMKFMDYYALINLQIRTSLGGGGGEMLVSKNFGIIGEAMMSKVQIGPLLITGKGLDKKYGTKDDGPIIRLALTLFEQEFLISGLINLFGNTGQRIEVLIGHKGIQFDTELKILGVFSTKLKGRTFGFNIKDMILNPEKVKPEEIKFDLEGEIKLGQQMASLKGILGLNPLETVFLAQLNKFTLADTFAILNDFGAKVDTSLIPQIGFKDVYFGIAFKPITFKERKYNPGLSFGATLLTPFDMPATVEVAVGAHGLVAKGTLKGNQIGPLKITGAGLDQKRGTADDGPVIILAITKNPQFFLDGEIELFGAKLATHVNIEKDKFRFKTEADVFLGMFKAIIEAESIGQIGQKNFDFRIKAKMQNDFFKVVRERAHRDLEAFKKHAAQEIYKAQQDVQNAKKDKDKAMADIEKAKRDVRRAQKGKRLAMRDIDKAQAEVNKLQNDINNFHHEIAQWKDYCDKALWYEKVPKCIETGAQLTKCGLAIAGLETAKGIATGALQASKAIVDKGGDFGLGIAEGTLEVARLTVRDVTGPVLDVAIGILEAAKHTAYGIGDVGKVLSSAVLEIEKIINIQSAELEASLAELGQGVLPKMTIKAKLFGDQREAVMQFDFKDPIKSIGDILKALWDLVGIKIK